MIDIKVMSIHLNSDCNYSCPFCYIDKTRKQILSPGTLIDLIDVCKELHIEQISVGGGEPYLHPDYLWFLSEECKNKDIIMNITTNGTHAIMIPNLGLVSISIDSFKLTKSPLSELIETANFYRQFNKVGFNILLDEKIQENLYPLLSKLEPHCDYMYLLQMKNKKVPLDRKKIMTAVVISGDKILVDESIKLSFGLSKHCNRGRNIVSIHPDGSIRPCSFSDPIGYLSNKEDLVKLIKEIYPMEATKKCPYIL